MTTAIDTNIFAALWDEDNTLNLTAQASLDAALGRGSLAIPGSVFAELLACPGRSEEFVDSFLRETGIAVDWELEESIWRAAGRAYQSYASRRRKQGDTGARRILSDFLIGAYAQVRGYRLLTLDERIYQAAFPGLRLTVPKAQR